MHLVKTGPWLKRNLLLASRSTVATHVAAKWRNSAEQVQGHAAGDAQLGFHPVHQNALTCHRRNGATVISTDKLQRCCSSLLRSCTASFSRAAAEKLCLNTKIPQSGCGLTQEQPSLSKLGRKIIEWIRKIRD